MATPTTLEVRGIETIRMGARLERFDVIVVGGGIAGASVAWHLRDRGRVLLLERGPAFGAEAASQNAGMVRRLGEDPWERALAIRTVERLVALDSNPGPFQISPSRVVGAVLGLHE